jgi:flagellin
MQEIQDMLNRMDYLATQSANGTYDNEVDRAALQKEVDQLKSEINRIADSANFNGIKLLDGSMDGNARAAVEAAESTAAGMLPDVGHILGTDTVLHAEAGQAAANTTMSVDLHNLAVNGTKGQTFTIDVGGTKLIGTLQGDFSNTALSAQNIADALGNGTTANVSFAYEDGTAYNSTAVKFGADGAEFTASASGNRITFTQNNPDDVDFDPELKVNISAGTAKASPVATSTTTAGTNATGQTAATYTSNGAIDASTMAVLANAKTGNQYTVTIGGKSIDIAALAADGTTRNDLVTAWSNAFSETGFTVDVSGDDLVIKKTGTTAGVAADFEALGFTGGTVSNDGTDTLYTITNGVKNFKDAAGNTGIADMGDANKYSITVDGLAQNVTAKLDSTDAELGQAYVDAYNKAGGTGETDLATASYDAATKKITLTANAAGDETITGAPTTQSTTALGSMTGGTGTKGTNNAATQASSVIDFTGKTGQDVINGTITVGDKTYEFVENAADVSGTHTAVVVTKNATADQIAATLAAAAAPTDTTAVANTSKVTFTADNAGAADSTKVAVTVGKAGGDPKISGDYNVSTTNIAKKGEAAGERLASTYFNLSKAMAANGNQITIGKTTYTFTTDEADKGKLDANADNKVYVGDLDLSKKEDLIEAADRLTKVANGNSTYTVGHDGTRMTFTEKKGQTDFVEKDGTTSSLTSLEAIEKSFGFKTAGKEAVEADDSKALTLQIGDTSESYNQLKVSIGDMHTDAMGIADLNIGNQTDAAAAIQTIRDAINYVSGVRGDLGATQNRLEHTANNLSVMAENIQDAESTIRDTDIAEEMMSYTKNNILVQSAQAMLAQANQVPQGVLQLLG